MGTKPIPHLRSPKSFFVWTPCTAPCARGRPLILFFRLWAYSATLVFEVLRDNREALLTWGAAERALGSSHLHRDLCRRPSLFSLPGGAVMSITGRLLYSAPFGDRSTSSSAPTLGATTLFVIAKTALGDVLRSKGRAPGCKKMEAGFSGKCTQLSARASACASLSLFCRGIWVPAFSRCVALPTYVARHILSALFPGFFVFASVGAGLGSNLRCGRVVSAPPAFSRRKSSPALVGLAVLAIHPCHLQKDQRAL